VYEYNLNCHSHSLGERSAVGKALASRFCSTEFNCFIFSSDRGSSANLLRCTIHIVDNYPTRQMAPMDFCYTQNAHKIKLYGHCCDIGSILVIIINYRQAEVTHIIKYQWRNNDVCVHFLLLDILYPPTWLHEQKANLQIVFRVR